MSLKVFVIFIPRAFNIIYFFTNIPIDVHYQVPSSPYNHISCKYLYLSHLVMHSHRICPNSNENKPFTHQVAKN